MASFTMIYKREGEFQEGVSQSVKQPSFGSKYFDMKLPTLLLILFTSLDPT